MDMPMNILRIFFILILSISVSNAVSLENCKWNNSKGVPCTTIIKTPNTSSYNAQGVNKKVFTKQQIDESGATSALDLLKKVSGLDYYSSGQKGQQAAIFMRGSESNHTLVLLNGIAINDQSATNGMHDFGQDFVQTVQQIEVYKGSNGAHFGPDAIGGAINFVTDVDYTNSYSVNGLNLKNNSVDYNTTKITDNGWHLNFKGSANQSKTDSAIAKGNESDGTKNYQVNLNGNKWLNDNLKLKSTFYYRDTKSGYDKSATKEGSVTSDNKMYALQTGIESKTNNSLNNIMFHYHNYDRKYYVQGKKDKYYSESLVAKAEREVVVDNKISYGFGSEYKYDWGHYLTKTFTSQTTGHLSNLGVFANAGYKFNENQVLSVHGRNDDHKETGGNQTYKINFTQFLGQFKLGATHSTGLKNASLYEFYGNGGDKQIKPEKSETNELFGEYNFSENIKFSSTAYRTRMKDRIKLKSDWSGYENKVPDTTQEGLESEITWSGNNQSISLVSHFAKSRTVTAGPNSRRPDVSYGIDYFKKFNVPEYGPFDLNLSHRYIGDHIDWTGSANAFVKSVDLVDVSIRKDFYGNIISLNLTNLLNERYEKPATYSQDGRSLSLGLRKKY
jgi:vitamin B12 transporter